MVIKDTKHRYLLVDFLGPKPNIGILVSNLRKRIQTIAGDIFLANSAIHLITVENDHFIVRATNNSRDVVEASIQTLKLENTVLKVTYVSGTIKKIQQIKKNLQDYGEKELIDITDN